MKSTSIKDILARLRHDPLLVGDSAELVIEHRGAPDDKRCVVCQRRALNLGPGGFSVDDEPFIPYHRVLSIRCGELVWERDAGFVSRPRRAAESGVGEDELPAAALRDELESWGVVPDDNAWRTLGLYRKLIERGNRIHNLVSRSLARPALERLIVESLLALPVLGAGACRLLDVGSGAGLPGLPLSIVSPALEVTLLDASAKRSAFLRAAVEALELESVSVVTARAEDPAEAQYRAICLRGIKWPPRADALARRLESGGMLLSFDAPRAPETGAPGWRCVATVVAASVVLRAWRAPRST